MKKLIYVLLVAISSSLVFVSCTEEEVTPKTENGGAEISTGKI